MATMNLKVNLSAYTVLGVMFFCAPEFSYNMLTGEKKAILRKIDNLLISTIGAFFLLNASYSYHLLKIKCLVTRAKYFTANTTLFLLLLLVIILLLIGNKNVKENDTLIMVVLFLLLINNYIGLKRANNKLLLTKNL